MVDFKVLFDGMSVDEMKDSLKAINAEAKEFIKASEAVLKESAMADAKAFVKVGDTVTVKYKDSTISGEVLECRDKTFTILTGDVLNAKGAASKVARAYNLVVR